MRFVMRDAMTVLMLGSMLGLAACGSDPAPAPEAEEPPIIMQAGAWELTRKTTGYNTCLLYTSPSPRDRQKSRMPSSA